MDKENTERDSAHATAPRQKSKYIKPVLTVYGSVRELTKGSGGTRSDFGNHKARFSESDRRLKENIVRIGEHPLGIGVYLFDYKKDVRDGCGHNRQFGVMADEVETVLPEAVFVRADGYKMVDYAQLGIVRH